MDTLSKAKRVNQAYEQRYGPDNLLNAPITRDLAANNVIARRGWFPSVVTNKYFASPIYNTLHINMKNTGGIDMNDRESFRPKTMPGQISQFSTYGPEQDSGSSNILMYAVGILLLVAVIAIVF
jgi:hypothetical protein